jgi:rhodanese-related sulfurtransferase
MWRRISPTLAGLVAGLAAVVASAQEHTKDSLQTVKESIAKEKAVLVDVRDKQEWNKGHIEVAILLPFSELRLRDRTEEMIKDLPKDRILYTHCVVGMRSKQAAEILKKHGFEVRALKPGYDELLKAGFAPAKKK